MDQRLTTQTALPTDYSLVPASMSGSLQPPAKPDQGNLMTSCGLCKHSTHMHKLEDTHRYILKNEFNKKKPGKWHS